MYPWEIQKFLEERNYLVGGDDLLKVISPEQNKQYKEIKFDDGSNIYYIEDIYGNKYSFKAMKYKDAVKNGLVKKKQDHDFDR